jgi:hypothetical protein
MEKLTMPRTGKVSKAPEGYYTASEAIKRLNMPKTTFHHYVKIGKIKKKIPYGRKEGYYEKSYIDKMAEASQLYAIQYAEEPTTFSVATPEDVQGIYQVVTSLWGALSATPVEKRLEWYKSNPEIDYVVKHEGIVTGYLSIMPLKHEIIEQLMSAKIRGWDIKPEDILPFTPGMELECYVGAAVRAGLHDSKKYGMRLISGAIKVLKDLAQRGIIIKKMYGVSDTPDGIRLSRGLGFEEAPPAPGSTFRQFVLDLETSQSPFVQEYREILKRGQQEKPL